MSEDSDGQGPGPTNPVRKPPAAPNKGEKAQYGKWMESLPTDLQNHIFDISPVNPTDSFQKSLVEITEYIKLNVENAQAYSDLPELKLEAVDVPQPPKERDSVEYDIWKMEYPQRIKARESRSASDTRVFAIIWKQCTPIMKDRIRSTASYKSIREQTNIIGLLELIRSSTMQRELGKEPSQTLRDATVEFYGFRQVNMSVSDYHQKFQDLLAVLEDLAGPIGQDNLRTELYLGKPVSSASTAEVATARAACREMYLATCFIDGADKKRYSELKNRIKNDYTIHGTGYPRTLTAAYRLMVRYRPDDRQQRSRTEVSFYQEHDDESSPGNNTRGRGRGRRHNKSGRGGHHPNRQNPQQGNSMESESTNPDTSNLDNHDNTPYPDLRSVEYAFKQFMEQPRLPDNWIIMDSGSSIDMFANPNLLEEIHEAEEPLRVISTGGVTTVTKLGTLPGYPNKVWCHPGGVANILSMSNVKSHFRVTYDNHDCDVFRVHLAKGRAICFRSNGRGLYYYDTNEGNNRMFSLLNTVQDRKQRYSQRGVQQAELARRVQNIIMRPPARKFMELVSNNLIKNCPVERRHIQAAEEIFGPNLGALKGKTRRHTVDHVPGVVDTVPPEILSKHREVTLCVDIMFVNKVPFLLAISRGLRIATVHALLDRQVTTIRDAIRNVIAIYKRRGFTISLVLADDEFEPLERIMPEQQFNCCGADEHVPEIERFIQTIKDTVRSQYNDLPFRHIPRLVIIHMVKNAVFWWNALPVNDSALGNYSGRYILEGRTIDYNKHIRIPFGAYAQTHEEHDNDMQPRTVGAICLGPTGNQQGTHYFMSLLTGRLLRRPHFTELPMPADVADRVSHLGRLQGMPRTLTFANRYGQELHDGPDAIDDDHDSDYEYNPSDDDASDDASVFTNHSDSTASNMLIPDDDDDADDIPDDNSTIRDPDPLHPTEPIPDAHADAHDYDPAPNIMLDETDNGSVRTTGVDSNDEEESAGTPAGSTGVGHILDNAEPDPSQITGVDGAEAADHDTRTMNLRPRTRAANPTHILGRGFEDAFIFLTAQMSVKKGLKMFKDKGAEAVIAEMQQLHYRNVIKPVFPQDLTREQKRAALHYIMFLKQKRCGRIKARGCADGRKQRLWKSKHETSSPTVRTESVFITSIIDAMEQRRVMTVDIPGAFMQTDIDEVIHVKLEEELVELLTRVNPDHYQKFVTRENGKKVLYVQLQKALYGTLQAALLFWKELSGFLVQQLGFELNPYDNCVANKTINGKQCTICWHVDDLKLSHCDQAVLEQVLEKLNERFGKEDPLSVNRGDVHDYLGMTLDFSTAGKVKFTMVDFIESMLEELPDDMDGHAATPAANYLFKINRQALALDDSDAEMFHTNVAKLLYLSKRARPDIQTAVAFLSTRVVAPNVDDYGKLKRCMRYLRATKDLPLVLEGDPAGRIRWWVDASFAVHHDMKSHTGAVMSLGKGAAYGMSTRQKINSTSSTEAELVGVSDAMPNVVWTRNFLLGQGFTVHDNVVYQDNQSAILLEKNGRRSSGKRTRHISIRYFFVTDKIENKEMRVEYCPTEDMLADIFTKPLQGSLFRKLRDRLLNVDSTNFGSPQVDSQECVGAGVAGVQTDRSKNDGHAYVALLDASTEDDPWILVRGRPRRSKRYCGEGVSSHNRLMI